MYWIEVNGAFGTLDGPRQAYGVLSRARRLYYPSASVFVIHFQQHTL